MPDGVAYFCSRGSVLGQVPGEVVAATFGVFNPAVVVPLVASGWALTTAETHLRGAHRGRGRPARADPRRAARRTRARHRAAAAGERPAAARRSSAVRRAARSRPARRPDGRHVAARRSAARVPRRRAHRGVERGRFRRHGDRLAHRALLGAPDADVHPHAGVERRRSRRSRGAPRRARAGRRRWRSPPRVGPPASRSRS